MPRSPSRDLADRFRGNRGYFRRLEPLRWGKYAITIVLLGGAIVWAAADLVKPAERNFSYSHGPLATVHAAWDDNCAVCHNDHSSVSWGLKSLFQTRTRWHDLTCQRCHTGAAHHQTTSPESTAFQNDCASCHHDHDGRDKSLTRMSDDHCTKCHANLNHAAGATKFVEKITSITTDHPEIRALKENSAEKDRTLKFSHALHMTEGLTYVPNGKEAITEKRVTELSSATYAARYSYGKTGLVKLECRACHQLDSGADGAEYKKLQTILDQAGEPSKSVLPPRAEGAYFLPVNFEAHCRACHQLKAPEGVFGEDRMNIIKSFDVLHRKQTEELKNEITAGYFKGLADSKHAAMKPLVEPGGLPDPNHAKATRTIRDDVNRMTETAMSKFLSDKSGCAKCHDLTGAAIAPVPDHTVWFQHAKFNHASHRGVTCANCHPNCNAAFAPDGNVLEKEPLQILGINSCKACHAPKGTQVEIPGGERLLGGGVRHSCVDCHRYHNGDHALEGRGSDAFKPVAGPLTLSEFLKGK